MQCHLHRPVTRVNKNNFCSSQRKFKIVAIASYNTINLTPMAPKPATASSAIKEAKNSQSKTKFAHPPIAKMVNKAIEDMNEKGGSSVRAIKKYVAANYMIDAEKSAPFIKKYLARAVLNKILLQTKGRGFTGSFKMAPQTIHQKKETTQRHVTASGIVNEEGKTTKKTKAPSSASGITKKESKNTKKPPAETKSKPSSAQQSQRSARMFVERRSSRMSNVSWKMDQSSA